MAVNTVTAALAQRAGYPSGDCSVAVLQSTAGATGDSTFVIDCLAAKSGERRSMRERTLHIVTVGTAFGAISSLNTSPDGTNYETLKNFHPATIGANTTEAAAAVPAVTTALLTSYLLGHDFRYLKIVTTGGDATSGFTVLIGN